MKKKKFSVIVNVNLEYIVKAKNRTEAEQAIQEIELPKQYVEDSFEIVKVGEIDKDGYADYNEAYGQLVKN